MFYLALLAMPNSASTPPQTVLGFDFGMKRIGVAVGQSITKTANPLTILPAKDGVPDWSAIQKLIDEWSASALIVGIPWDMGGQAAEITAAATRFAKRLQQKFDLPLHTVDERLTSKAAKAQILASGDVKKNEKLRLDAVAAKIIVEDWLNQM